MKEPKKASEWGKLIRRNEEVDKPDVDLERGGFCMSLSPGDIADILKIHNNERTAVGVPPLTWSNLLAQGAQAWADHLATVVHMLLHSGLPGENLAGGSVGFFSPAQLIDATWVKEKANFIAPCTFQALTVGDPCSRTGNWRDIGHYTQMVWRHTTDIGCGWASDSNSAYLVCRYSPPGNIIGQAVF